MLFTADIDKLITRKEDIRKLTAAIHTLSQPRQPSKPSLQARWRRTLSQLANAGNVHDLGSVTDGAGGGAGGGGGGAGGGGLEPVGEASGGSANSAAASLTKTRSWSSPSRPSKGGLFGVGWPPKRQAASTSAVVEFEPAVAAALSAISSDAPVPSPRDVVEGTVDVV